MTPSRERLILGIISFILFLLITYVSFALSSGRPQDQLHIDLIATAIISFNAALAFGWLAFGEWGGVPMTAAAVILALWVVLRAGFYTQALLTLSFLVTAFIGHGYIRIKERIEQVYMLKIEKTEEETNLFANSISEKDKVIGSLEEKLSRYSALKEVTEALSTVLSLDAINELIVEKTGSTIGKDARVLLFLVDMKKQELMLSASKEVHRTRAKKGDVFDQWVLRHRKSLIIEDIEKDFRFSTGDVEEARQSFRSLITTPLVSEDKVIGVLRMDSKEESLFTQDDLRLLNIISDLGAVAIQNALLFSRTQELAIRDGLTELIVRRYFTERFREEIKRAARGKNELAVLMLDIDNFKEYNDKYGHMAGDLVLKHLARVLTAMTREGDIVARYGGEEIVMLLLDTDREKALKAAEAIRKRVEAEPLVLRRQKTFVTASVGLSVFPRDGMSEEELLRAADERLYKAKEKGRNRVCAG
ncbi:MAG: sensor domain-containing diguanylate cyclase [Candidatus Omnitrophica bacterium]|nr:sensor domain-containing diguanylate cyclase [Candidatus Omnitrophota bacterium]